MVSEAFALLPDLQVGYIWHASKFTSEVLAGLPVLEIRRNFFTSPFETYALK